MYAALAITTSSSVSIILKITKKHNHSALTPKLNYGFTIFVLSFMDNIKIKNIKHYVYDERVCSV